jgi:predicted TIM-barrel fold metal-dependent hydrolase
MTTYPTRRRFLISSATVAAAGCSRKPVSPARRGYVDSHSHVWTPDTVRFPLGPWITAKDMAPASFTAEELLAVAEPCGVERVVLIQHSPYYGSDNGYLIDCAARFPGRFAVVAIVDERRADLAEHLRELKKQGVRGLRIGPNRYADRTPVPDPANWLKASAMRRLWELATAEGLVVCPLVNADQLPTLEPMLAAFPDTTVALDHFGHCRAEDPAELRLLLSFAKHSRFHVKASGFYKFGDKTAPYDDLVPILRHSFEAFGPARLLWGSDCPYQLQAGNTYRDAVELIENGLGFLDAAARTAILRGNTERLFFA